MVFPFAGFEVASPDQYDFSESMAAENVLGMRILREQDSIKLMPAAKTSVEMN